MNDPRFASLRGASRQYLDEFDLEDFEDFEPDEDLLGLDAAYADSPHDGWSEIRPVYEAMRTAYTASASQSA